MRTPATVGIIGRAEAAWRFESIFRSLPQADVRWICEPDGAVRGHAVDRPRHLRLTAEVDDVLSDDDTDAVIVAVPLADRAAIVRDALAHEKHVFVEAPVANSGEDTDELLALADARKRRLFIDHDLVSRTEVSALKQLLDSGNLGEIYYLDSVHLGPYPSEAAGGIIGADIADDVAVVLHLVEDQPIEVRAHVDAFIRADAPDVCSCVVRFATGISAYLRSSWLDNRPARSVTVVGSRGIVVCDHLAVNRPLTVCEKAGKSLAGSSSEDLSELGDFVVPQIPSIDPLPAACERFLAAVRAPGTSVTNTRFPAAVAHVLSALRRSAQLEGENEPVHVESGGAAIISLPVSG